MKSKGQANHLSDMIKVWPTVLNENSNDKVTKAILHAILYVAHELENQRAMLFPCVSKVFLYHYLEATSHDVKNQVHVLKSSEGTIKFTSHWLLKQLTVHLHSHMSSKCIHKKFGILLFRKGGDFLTSLSWALGTGKFEEVSYEQGGTLAQNLTLAKFQWRLVISYDIIHSEITRHSTSNLIKNMDQINTEQQIITSTLALWPFIESITHTVKQRQGTGTMIIALSRNCNSTIFCLLLYCT